MITIKRFLICVVALVLVLSTGCNSKNETSNKPQESTTSVNEIINDTQTKSSDNESENNEITEEETTQSDSGTSTEAEIDTSSTQTEEIPTTDVVDTNIEENNTQEDVESTDSIVQTTPEEDYNYIIADDDEDEEDTVETIASNTDSNSVAALSTNNTEYSWWYSPQENHIQPSASKDLEFAKFDSYYLGSDSKEIYLTFDEGYENGYTPKILDTLKENNVKAAFFVTKPFVTSQPDLIKRMIDEGHLVCNHSVTHPNFATKTNDEIIQEIKGVEDAVYEVAGTKTAKFFRPPAGVYSERVLSVLKSIGYKTIFWSFAHRDWELDNQPPVETTIKRVMDNHHNGMIMLIHAVSQSNTDALDTIIKNLKGQGYEFVSLENLK